ncbi:hypothetical protein SCLCIDRAFT_51511, partial [Scleroderma citrinum Foug A]
LCKLAFKLVHSTMFLLPAWYTILKELDLPPKLILRDISTQWNSSCDLMGFAVEYHEAIDRIPGDQKFDLRNYEMIEMDYVIWCTLTTLLKVLKDATEFFSWATPNLATVIPAMDH